MRKTLPMKKILIVLTIVALLMGTVVSVPAAPACSPDCGNDRALGESTPGNTFLDALIYRPIGLVAIPVGAVLFVVSLPFSATGGNIPIAFDNLVVYPARYTFCRPLGDL